MGRYWRTLRRFWGTAVAVQLEYQANVLIELLAVAMSLSGSLFLLSLFYGPDQTLGGWSWAQALMVQGLYTVCLLYTSPSPRDRQKSRMPSSA